MQDELDPIAIAHLEERRQALATVDVSRESEPVGGGWMSYAGSGSWANQACGLGLEGPVSGDDLDRLTTFYESRGVEARIEVCALADASLVDGLAARGYVLREFENVFASALPVGGLRARHPHDLPAGLRIERVDPGDDEQVEAHARIALSGFVETPSPALLDTARRSAKHPRTHAFNAVVDGAIVGACAMEASEGVAALFGTSVLPAHRCRGIQLALILERMSLARALGCRIATLHSRPGIPTERNARRAGFALAYAKAILARPGAGLERSL